MKPQRNLLCHVPCNLFVLNFVLSYNGTHCITRKWKRLHHYLRKYTNNNLHQIFLPSRPTLWPTQPPVQWVPGLFGVKVWLGRAADHSPPSSAEVLEDKSYTSTPLWATTGPVTGLLYLYLLTIYTTLCTHIVYCLSFLNTHHFLRNPHASADLNQHLVLFNDIHLIHLIRYWPPNLETVNS